MRDLFFVAFLAAMFGLGLKRPFLLVLAYAYIDIVSPQKLSYWLVNSIPVSLIAFVAAVAGWIIADNKRDTRLSWRQAILLALLGYCGFTTVYADFPVDALAKWDWVWKALVFAIFLPLTLRTRLRIEALSLVMVLCASSIIITGGIKTALSGGGYGTLYLMTDSNSGLYEGSTISTVAIALIPLILYLAKHGTIFPPDRRVRLFAYALCFACLLIPVGTEARTGLVCAAVLAGLFFIHMQRRILFAGAGALALIAAIPFLPQSFLDRMDTLHNVQGDESASTRMQVWAWTLGYVEAHPLGGGFDAYRGNSFRYQTVNVFKDVAGNERVERNIVVDKGRAYHSAYFEMLGEQGWPGFALWLLLHGGTLVQTGRIARRYAGTSDPDRLWVAPYARAMGQGHIVYLVGALFVGIAFQPFIFMLLALQIGLATYLRRVEAVETWQPLLVAHPNPRAAGASPRSARATISA